MHFCIIYLKIDGLVWSETIDHINAIMCEASINCFCLEIPYSCSLYVPVYEFMSDGIDELSKIGIKKETETSIKAMKLKDEVGIAGSKST